MFNNDFKNNFNNNYNTGNLVKDRINFETYNKATGLNSEIKFNDNIGFKQFQDMMLGKK